MNALRYILPRNDASHAVKHGSASSKSESKSKLGRRANALVIIAALLAFASGMSDFPFKMLLPSPFNLFSNHRRDSIAKHQNIAIAITDDERPTAGWHVDDCAIEREIKIVCHPAKYTACACPKVKPEAIWLLLLVAGGAP